MKKATTVVVIFLSAISIVHLLRLIYRVGIAVNGVNIPMWVSILGCIVPALLALMLWLENRRSDVYFKRRPYRMR